mmetsp:Transcript_18439/g.43648  ORF Transcript_18439/g.43648 Transcript_18439/m.43648 type:complete len:232 (-) Transcript_18439:107-802(-)
MLSGHLIDRNGQGRLQPEAGETKGHAWNDAPCFPADAIQELGHAPDAEGIDLIRGEVLHNFLQLVHIRLESFAPTHSDVCEVPAEIWLLADLRDDELIEGPKWHHKGRGLHFDSRGRLPGVLSVGLVKVADDPLNCFDEDAFQMLSSSRTILAVGYLDAEKELASGHLLQAHLESDLPQTLPSAQMPAIRVVGCLLAPGLVGGSMCRENLHVAEVVLLLMWLGGIGTVHPI